MGGSGSLVVRDIVYRALPSQRRFHQSTARFKGFSGPIGSGKSQALCQEAIRLTYLNPGRTGLLGAPTYPMLKDATQTALLQLLIENDLPFDLSKSDQVLTMLDTGSRILFRAVEEFDRLRGTNLAWFGVDELSYAPEQAWLRLEGRLRDPKASRLCGFAVWTPKGHDWVWRRFIESPPAGYEVIRAKPFENRHVLDKIPDYYERLRGSYEDKFFAQEVMGEYLNSAEDLVYHAFDRTRHVGEFAVVAGRPLLWALDFNVNPMSSVVAQWHGEELRVIDEISLKRATTADCCDEFVRRYGRHPGGVVIFGDASGRRSQTTGASDYSMLREGLERARISFDYRVPASNPPVRDRVAQVNAAFQGRGGRRLLVDQRCRELVRDFEEVRYVPDGMEIDKGRDAMRTHMSDALGYLVYQQAQPRAAAGERAERLI